jgi:succinoglycan biosynthesis protein ExoU
MTINESSVCVIIAAFNSRGTITRAITSALLQSDVSEVVVADDASRDDTAALARAADDGSGRLTVIALGENRGPAAARNAALQRSKSPYVCVLDADDYFLPDRISRLLGVADKSWDLIADDILIVPEDQRHLEFSVVNSGPPASSRTLDLEAFVRGNISDPRRMRGELGFLKPIIKRSFLEQHSLRYDERLRLGEDYALYTRALLAGARFYLANTCGYIAIERKNSISSDHSARDLEKIIAFDTDCLNNMKQLNNAERAAVAAHRAGTVRKHDHRTVIDHKLAFGYLSALALLSTMPRSIPYIAVETARAKTGRLFAMRNDSAPVGQIPGLRFLVGVPGTHLRYSAPNTGRSE